MVLSEDMEPIQQESTAGRFDNLKKVTPLSKYLAMMLFIILPFAGGYVGYTFAPTKIVEVDRIVEVPAPEVATQQATPNMVSMCGRNFEVNEVFVEDINLTQKLDQLLRSPLQSPTKEDIGSSCAEFLENVSDSTVLTVTLIKTKYGFTAFEFEDQFEAYAVQFVATGQPGPLDVGFFVDKNTLEVFRIFTLDGSKGLKVGSLR